MHNELMTTVRTARHENGRCTESLKGWRQQTGCACAVGQRLRKGGWKDSNWTWCGDGRVQYCIRASLLWCQVFHYQQEINLANGSEVVCRIVPHESARGGVRSGKRLRVKRITATSGISFTARNSLGNKCNYTNFCCNQFLFYSLQLSGNANFTWSMPMQFCWNVAMVLMNGWKTDKIHGPAWISIKATIIFVTTADVNIFFRQMWSKRVASTQIMYASELYGLSIQLEKVNRLISEVIIKN